MEMPDNTFLAGCADDVAAVITSWTPELAQIRLNLVLRRVNGKIPTVILMTVRSEVVTYVSPEKGFACFYRTVSEAAALVVAGIVPMTHPLAKER
ncbi:hypothetical protein J6590_026592 [Homalodisca vitripennis]|nr:hypothetical protein J6590_026592 [Homalodisca vitripennis]